MQQSTHETDEMNNVEIPERYRTGACVDLNEYERSILMAAEKHSASESFPMIGFSLPKEKAREVFPNLHKHMCLNHLKHAGVVRFKKSILKLLPDFKCVFLNG